MTLLYLCNRCGKECNSDYIRILSPTKTLETLEICSECYKDFERFMKVNKK